MSYPTNACCPEDLLKDALGVSSTADDDMLDSLAAAVTRLMEDYVGPIITRDQITLYARRGMDVCDVYVPKIHRPGTLGIVAERSGSTTYNTLTIDTQFVTYPARGSSDDSILSGRLTRVNNIGQSIPWPQRHQAVRITNWVPGRFATALECADSQDGATFVQAFILTFKHLWQPYTTQIPAPTEEFATLRPVWPGWALPRAAQELLVEHAEKRALVAGYDG